MPELIPAGSGSPEWQTGQEAIWTGTKGLFAHRVRIAEVRQSYLMIFGETPDDAKTVYDIADPVIGTTVLGIPGEQLRGIDA